MCRTHARRCAASKIVVFILRAQLFAPILHPSLHSSNALCSSADHYHCAQRCSAGNITAPACWTIWPSAGADRVITRGLGWEPMLLSCYRVDVLSKHAKVFGILPFANFLDRVNWHCMRGLMNGAIRVFISVGRWVWLETPSRSICGSTSSSK